MSFGKLSTDIISCNTLAGDSGWCSEVIGIGAQPTWPDTTGTGQGVKNKRIYTKYSVTGNLSAANSGDKVYLAWSKNDGGSETEILKTKVIEGADVDLLISSVAADGTYVDLNIIPFDRFPNAGEKNVVPAFSDVANGQSSGDGNGLFGPISTSSNSGTLSVHNMYVIKSGWTLKIYKLGKEMTIAAPVRFINAENAPGSSAYSFTATGNVKLGDETTDKTIIQGTLDCSKIDAVDINSNQNINISSKGGKVTIGGTAAQQKGALQLTLENAGAGYKQHAFAAVLKPSLTTVKGEWDAGTSAFTGLTNHGNTKKCLPMYQIITQSCGEKGAGLGNGSSTYGDTNYVSKRNDTQIRVDATGSTDGNYFTVTITNGNFKSIVLKDGFKNLAHRFMRAPKVWINSPKGVAATPNWVGGVPNTGSGVVVAEADKVQATAISTIDKNGQLTGITITNEGLGYRAVGTAAENNNAYVITIESPYMTGLRAAYATVTLDADTVDNDGAQALNTVTMNSSGIGYEYGKVSNDQGAADTKNTVAIHNTTGTTEITIDSGSPSWTAGDKIYILNRALFDTAGTSSAKAGYFEASFVSKDSLKIKVRNLTDEKGDKVDLSSATDYFTGFFMFAVKVADGVLREALGANSAFAVADATNSNQPKDHTMYKCTVNTGYTGNEDNPVSSGNIDEEAIVSARVFNGSIEIGAQGTGRDIVIGNSSNNLKLVGGAGGTEVCSQETLTLCAGAGDEAHSGGIVLKPDMKPTANTQNLEFIGGNGDVVDTLAKKDNTWSFALSGKSSDNTAKLNLFYEGKKVASFKADN